MQIPRYWLASRQTIRIRDSKAHSSEPNSLHPPPRAYHFPSTSKYSRSVPGALLCMSSCPERALFATGSYNRTVFVFDSRSGHKPIRQYRPHTGAVIKLAMNTEYILSASEDKTVSVWDQRAGRTMKSITVMSHSLTSRKVRRATISRCTS